MDKTEKRDLNTICQRIESYRFLGGIFLTLPDEDFVNNLLGLRLEQPQQSQGMQQIDNYIKRHQLNTVQNVLQELAIDRAKLLRGLTQTGPRPPYESLYLNQPPQDIVLSLKQFFSEINYCVSEELKESPEQLGVEFSFMHELYKKELEALENGLSDEAGKYSILQQSFLKQHLGRWAGMYAKEMQQYAQTDFYRGIGLLIQELISEELPL